MSNIFGYKKNEGSSEPGPRGPPGIKGNDGKGVDNITFDNDEDEFVITYTDSTTNNIPFPENSLNNYVSNSSLSTTLSNYAVLVKPTFTSDITIQKFSGGNVNLINLINTSTSINTGTAITFNGKNNSGLSTSGIYGYDGTYLYIDRTLIPERISTNIDLGSYNYPFNYIYTKIFSVGSDTVLVKGKTSNNLDYGKLEIQGRYDNGSATMFTIRNTSTSINVGATISFIGRDGSGISSEAKLIFDGRILNINKSLRPEQPTDILDLGSYYNSFNNLYIKRIYLDKTYGIGFEALAGSQFVYFNGQQFTPKTTLGATLGHIDYKWFALYTKFVYATDAMYINDVEVATIPPSDVRLKENILDIDLGLNFINELTPKKYNFIKDTDKKNRYGLIAQDVEQILDSFGVNNSEIVKMNKKNDTYSLNYTELIPILIKSVQQLSAKNIELENRLETLESFILNKK